jgi:hypothetical protein
MCWSFEIEIFDGYYKRIDTINKLINLYEYYNLSIPAKLISGYSKEDLKTETCLCPIQYEFFGVDKITKRLLRSRSLIGENHTFFKMNGKIVMVSETLEGTYLNKIEKKEIDRKTLFGKIIIDELIIKGKSFVIWFY